jgi:hypothetical protein
MSHKWQKGQSGNPSGGVKLPPEIKEFKKLSTKETIKILTNCIFMNREELSTRLHDPKTPAIELLICRILGRGIEKGDERVLNMMLDRIIGKVTEKIEHTLPRPTVVKLIGEEAAVVIGRMKAEEE